jgi:hypothetical protein
MNAQKIKKQEDVSLSKRGGHFPPSVRDAIQCSDDRLAAATLNPRDGFSLGHPPSPRLTIQSGIQGQEQGAKTSKQNVGTKPRLNVTHVPGGRPQVAWH